jgi:hypothetical protein
MESEANPTNRLEAPQRGVPTAQAQESSTSLVDETKGQEMQDDLSDVILTGVTLVSDNPADWIVPVTMAEYENVGDWWHALTFGSNQLNFMSPQIRRSLIWLADTYEQLQSEAFQGQSTVPHQAKIRSVLRQICKYGLTTEQTARLVRTSKERVVAELYCNRPLTPEDIAMRLNAEQQLRHGATVPEVVASSGLNRDQVETLLSTLSIEAKQAHTQYPAEVKQRAIDLRIEGKDNHEIAQIMLEEGHVIKPATVSKWWGRYCANNKKAGQ